MPFFSLNRRSSPSRAVHDEEDSPTPVGLGRLAVNLVSYLAVLGFVAGVPLLISTQFREPSGPGLPAFAHTLLDTKGKIVGSLTFRSQDGRFFWADTRIDRVGGWDPAAGLFQLQGERPREGAGVNVLA